MPMIPILPAKLVITVRPFLVARLLSERERAVRNDIEVFFCLSFFALLAFPLAILFGKHNGQTIGLIIGILISVLYWSLMTLGQIFGLRNGMNGFISMWLPNLLVGIFGCIFIFFLVKK